MAPVTDSIDVLREGWLEAAQSTAPDHPEVRDSLLRELESVRHRGDFSEPALLDAIDSVMRESGHGLPADTGHALVRRLQRSVYEYLLSLDAALPEERGAWAEERSAPPGALMIGAEEVAAMRPPEPAAPTSAPEPSTAADQPEPRAQTEPEHPAQYEPPAPMFEAPQAAAEPSPASASPPTQAPAPEGPVPEATMAQPAPATPEAMPPAPQAPDEPAAEAADHNATQAAPDTAEPAEAPRAASPAPSSSERGRRFAIFGRSTGRAPQRPAPQEQPAAEHPADLQQAVPQAEARSQESHALPEQAAPSTAPPVPAPRLDEQFTPLQRNRGQAGEPFIAPREGFHIQEDDGPLVISTPTELGAEGDGGLDQAAGGWSVRPDRASDGRRGRPAPDPVQTPQAIERRAEAEGFYSEAVAEGRRKVEERLSRKRCDEAAALVQKLAAEPGGRAVAELALDAGDRCRALAKSNAALSCYLAATRSDPVFDQPLLRLADICIDDHDIDLAVAYLERVARFYRLSGATTEALRVFRRIATIAPYRDDILGLLVRVQSTGRFDD